MMICTPRQASHFPRHLQQPPDRIHSHRRRAGCQPMRLGKGGRTEVGRPCRGPSSGEVYNFVARRATATLGRRAGGLAHTVVAARREPPWPLAARLVVQNYPVPTPTSTRPPPGLGRVCRMEADSLEPATLRRPCVESNGESRVSPVRARCGCGCCFAPGGREHTPGAWDFATGPVTCPLPQPGLGGSVGAQDGGEIHRARVRIGRGQ
ncbi:hypothetical protein C8Q77DRAFT_253483 [Trametes polyzona]|nr:hypothetical protein C8Q77DRAFT_253483 [Trametes polyzona]